MRGSPGQGILKMWWLPRILSRPKYSWHIRTRYANLTFFLPLLSSSISCAIDATDIIQGRHSTTYSTMASKARLEQTVRTITATERAQFVNNYFCVSLYVVQHRCGGIGSRSS